jgi:hypothetical protein
MNIKGFHIVFIICSTLLAFGFGMWCLNEGGPYRVPGVVSFFFGIMLIIYGFWFLRKLKNVRSL